MLKALPRQKELIKCYGIYSRPTRYIQYNIRKEAT